MKEIKLEDIMPVKEIENHIWNVLDILRGELSSDEYHVALFFLSLYKDDILPTESTSSDADFYREIQNKINDNILIGDNYRDIFKVFHTTVNKIRNETLRHFFHVISAIDKSVLSENFEEIFDTVLFRITGSQGRNGGEQIQPAELTNFICTFANLPVESNIFNPFAGLASFGVHLSEGQSYFGQEKNAQTWAVGALRIMAHQRPGSSRYVNGDSILNWPNPSQKFDLILANPPFGMRLNPRDLAMHPGLRTVEQFLIDKSLGSLTDKGKLIAVLPESFLFRGSHEQRLRQSLIEKDLIDTIISFPGGLLQNTGIPLIVLVIDKDKKLPGKVRFIDAKTFVEEKKSREKILNTYRLNSFLQGNKEDEDVLRVVDNSQIRDLNFNLHVPRYFLKEVEGTKLKDILEHVQGERRFLADEGKMIRIRDLKDDKLDFNLDLAGVETSEFGKINLRLIDNPCLLLAMDGRKLKPTYFKFAGEPIFINSSIDCFKVKEQLADTAYLISELNAAYVQEQLDAYRMGTTIPHLRKNDLLEVVIKLPSLEEQRAKMQGIVELSDKIKELKYERNLLALGIDNKVYESTSTIIHSLGTPVMNIGSALRNIEKALVRSNIELGNIRLNEHHDLTIKDSFNSVYDILELIHSIIKKNDSVLDVSKYELTEIEFLAFIKNYVNKSKTAKKDNVKIKLDVHPDIKNQLKNMISVNANAKLLDIGLNAIVENADMHAFTDDTKQYKLEFRVSLHVATHSLNKTDKSSSRFNNYLKVEVANNGKPIPENYTLEKLIRKNSFAGATGNTGQGGYDLNEIIKYHNRGTSTLELIANNLTSEFNTTYSFLIPLNI